MILLHGKKLAQEIFDGLKERVARMGKKPRLGIIVVGKDPVVEKFIAQKRKAAEAIGAEMRVYPFPLETASSVLRARAGEIVHEPKNTGVVVQLPLPPHMNLQHILNAVIPLKDADVLSARSVGDVVVGKSPVLPPVASAVKILLEAHDVAWRDKRIVVLGAGNLVGKPVALWLMSEKMSFSLVASHAAAGHEELLAGADIVISGIGKPKFITGEKVKEGVVIIDAGTSESEGKVVGDADRESLEKKAAALTPVPGGVGPLTVATLMANLVTLTELQQR